MRSTWTLNWTLAKWLQNMFGIAGLTNERYMEKGGDLMRLFISIVKTGLKPFSELTHALCDYHLRYHTRNLLDGE